MFDYLQQSEIFNTAVSLVDRSYEQEPMLTVMSGVAFVALLVLNQKMKMDFSESMLMSFKRPHFEIPKLGSPYISD
jgi:hypothetical protein